MNLIRLVRKNATVIIIVLLLIGITVFNYNYVEQYQNTTGCSQSRCRGNNSWINGKCYELCSVSYGSTFTARPNLQCVKKARNSSEKDTTRPRKIVSTC